MSLLPVLAVCQRKISLAVAVSQTTFTPVVKHAISVIAQKKKVSTTASTALITHAKASGHDKQRQSSSLISMELMPIWRILNYTVLTTGSIHRKSAGHVPIAARPFRGMLQHVPNAVAI